MRFLLPLIVLTTPTFLAAQVPCDEGAPPEPLPLACADQRPQLELDAEAVATLQWYAAATVPSTGLAARFRVSFVISPAGTPVRASFRFAAANPDSFPEDRMRRVASLLRYSPALRHGRETGVHFEQEIVLSHPGHALQSDSAPPLRLAVEQVDEATGARLHLAWVPVADAPVGALSARESRAVQLGALQEVIESQRLDASVIACVSFAGDREERLPTVEERSRLRRVHPRISAHDHCPPGYGGMIRSLDSLGNPRVRPPDAEPDPYHLRISGVTPWTDDWVVVRVQSGRAGIGRTFRCTAHRTDLRWSIECVTISRWLS